MSKTRGELRVRTDFNVTASTLVDQLKLDTAKLIDVVDGIDSTTPLSGDEYAELGRMQGMAMMYYEQAAMWAVKAATYEGYLKQTKN